MADKESYLRMLPSSIRQPLRKLFNSGAQLNNSVNLSKAVTTGLTMSGAMTTGLSISGACTTGINISGANTTAINVSAVQTDETGLDTSAVFSHGTYSTALAYGTQTGDHLVLKSMHITAAATAKYIMGDVNYITSSAASTGYFIVGYDYLSLGHDAGWSVARRSRVAITDDAEFGEIVCVQASTEIGAGLTITQEGAYSNFASIYGRIEVGAGTTVEQQLVGCYVDASYVSSNIAGEVSAFKAYCGGGTYVDYGFNLECISNNMTAGFNIEVTDSAILPVGINFERTTAGSITQAFRFSAVNVTPIVENAADVAGTSTSHALKLLIGSTQYYIPVYDTLSW